MRNVAWIVFLGAVATGAVSWAADDKAKVADTLVVVEPLPPGAIERLGSLRLRRTDPVLALALSADGQTLISGGMSGEILEFDTATGLATRRGNPLQKPTAQIGCVADGSLEVGHFFSGFARYNEDLRSMEWILEGEFMRSVPVGPSILVMTKNKGGVLMVTRSRETLREVSLRGGGSFAALAGSPDGKRGALTAFQREEEGGLTGRVLVLDSTDGSTVAQGARSGVHFSAMAFSPGGDQLWLGGTDGGLWQFDVATQEFVAVAQEHDGSVASVAVSTDGTSVATGGNDRKVTLTDATSRKLAWSVLPHDGAVSALCFSRDGGRLFSGGQDRRIQILDVASGKDLMPLPGHRGPLSATAWSPDGRFIATAGDGEVVIWSAPTETAGAKIVHRAFVSNGYIFAMEFSRDGRWIVATSAGGGLVVVNSETGRKESTLLDESVNALDVAFGPDGRLVAGGADGIARVWDLDAGRVVKRLSLDEKNSVGVAWSPDGTTIALAGKIIRSFDAATGESRGDYDGAYGSVVRLAYSADGARLVSIHRDRVVRVWEVATRALVGELRGHTGRVVDLDISRDGQRLVTCSYGENSARLWDLDAMAPLPTLAEHGGAVVGVAFAPGGDRIVTASVDTTALIWQRSAEGPK